MGRGPRPNFFRHELEDFVVFAVLLVLHGRGVVLFEELDVNAVFLGTPVAAVAFEVRVGAQVVLRDSLPARNLLTLP